MTLFALWLVSIVVTVSAAAGFVAAALWLAGAEDDEARRDVESMDRHARGMDACARATGGAASWPTW